MKRILLLSAVLLIASGCAAEATPERIGMCNSVSENVVNVAGLRDDGVRQQAVEAVIVLSSTSQTAEFVSIARYVYANPKLSADELVAVVEPRCLSEGLDAIRNLL